MRRLTVTCINLMFLALVVTQSVSAKNKKPYSVPVTAIDIVYSARTNLLYASVASESTLFPDTVALINTKKGKIVDTIPIGKHPARMALSPDELYLYVEIAGPRVKRINLDTNRVDLDFSVRGSESCEELFLSDMKVMPGHPETIAVVLFCREFNGIGGIAIYDNGVKRPVVSSDSTGVGRFCFGASPDVLYGYTTTNDGFFFWRFNVSPNGVSVDGGPSRDLVFAFHQELEFYNGLIYTTKGRVFDPETRILNGRFYNFEVLFASASALDKEAGQVYFTTRVEYDLILSCYDLKSFRLLSYYRGSTYGIGDATERLVRCGKGGLAAIGNGMVVFFPLTTLQPVAPYQKPQPVGINNQVRQIPMNANGLIYDSANRSLYATTPGWVGDIGNSVVKVDPFSGAVSDPVWVGPEPWQMTTSDDGQYLYVALYAGAAIQRLRLPGLQTDLRFPLQADNPAYGRLPVSAFEILPVKGRPESVIVARGNYISSPASEGVAIYDNGVRREITAPTIYEGGQINTIQRSQSGDLVYGLNTETTAFSFMKMAFDDSGIRIISRKDELGNGGPSMKCQADLCFLDWGLVINPITEERAGHFVIEDKVGDFLFDVRVQPDLEHGRVYFLVLRQTGVYIVSYDSNTFQQIASFKVPNAQESIGDFLMWNGDQFAFLADNSLFLVPAALVH
jgi:hypothetical protein